MTVDTERAVDWRTLATRAAGMFGTPLYVSAWQPVADAAGRLDRLRAHAPLRSWLSFKTHPLPQLAQTWLRWKRGVEVVSECELVAAQSAGASADTLLVNGIAKHTWLSRVRLPHLRIHFDSLSEAKALTPIARADRWRTGVRCHVPDERDARQPEYGGPFGLARDEAIEAIRHLSSNDVTVESVHFHLGQHPQDDDACARAVDYVADVCAAAGFEPLYVDLGGGLPGPADPRCAAAIEGLRSAIRLAERRFRALREVWLENGRFITEASAALVVRVVDVKERPDARYVICDGGRTNQALAADRGAHPLLIVPNRSGAPRLTTVCGPTCMTDDRLLRAEQPSDIAPGDLVVWLNAGAYHLPWETRFSHGLCAVAWCDEDGRLELARRREAPDAWAHRWNGAAA